MSEADKIFTEVASLPGTESDTISKAELMQAQGGDRHLFDKIDLDGSGLWTFRVVGVHRAMTPHSLPQAQ